MGERDWAGEAGRERARVGGSWAETGGGAAEIEVAGDATGGSGKKVGGLAVCVGEVGRSPVQFIETERR